MGELLPDAYDPEVVPEVGELDELETFIGSKKTKSGARSAVDHFKQGILGWVLGDHSGETFKPLWAIVEAWQCYFYVTDGWSVYQSFIPDGDQIISKTYMTRIEGENTRLRHYLARLHRKTLCYSKSEEMLRYKGSIATALSQILGCSSSSVIHTSFQQRRNSLTGNTRLQNRA